MLHTRIHTASEVEPTRLVCTTNPWHGFAVSPLSTRTPRSDHISSHPRANHDGMTCPDFASTVICAFRCPEPPTTVATAVDRTSWRAGEQGGKLFPTPHTGSAGGSRRLSRWHRELALRSHAATSRYRAFAQAGVGGFYFCFCPVSPMEFTIAQMPFETDSRISSLTAFCGITFRAS